MHPRQPLPSLFLWVDDEQAGSNPKVRFADFPGIVPYRDVKGPSLVQYQLPVLTYTPLAQ